MTIYGTTATIIGMYKEQYTDTFVSGNNYDFSHEEAEFTRHIIVAKSNLDKYLTFTLSNSMGECESGWMIATYGNLKIEIVNDDVIEKITHFPFEYDDTDFSVDLEQMNNQYLEYVFSCDIFNVSSNGGYPYYPIGSYYVYENLFLNFDIKKVKKEFIDTYSHELMSEIMSVVWRPENISHFTNLQSGIDFSPFADASKFIK